MDNVAVLSHKADIDGVGSAALVKMKYGIPAANIFFTGYSLEDMEYAEKGLQKLYRKRLLLFITDINPDETTAQVYNRIIRGIKSNGGRVVILDHHPWKKRMIGEIARRCDFAVFGENKNACATELVQRYTGLKGTFVDSFTYLVHHVDLFIRIKEKRYRDLAETYKMSIGYFNMSSSFAAKTRDLRHLADLISRKRFSDARVRKAALRFARLNSERIAKMLDGVTFVSEDMGIGFSKQIDSTDACRAIIERKHVDIGIVINTDHMTGSIRSESADVIRLANKLGGGGHPHAAGFSVNAKKYGLLRSQNGRKRLVDHIEESARATGYL